MSAFDRKDFRSDIVIGAEAMRLAVDSYGREGCNNELALMSRAKTIYAWLLTERKQ
jgi:hypothetical protein